jgi:hypothetical protein
MNVHPTPFGSALPWVLSGLALVLTIQFGYAWFWFFLVVVCSFAFVR